MTHFFYQVLDQVVTITPGQLTDIESNANINARAGYFETPRIRDPDPCEPFVITLPGSTLVINPVGFANQYAQPRSAERLQINGVTNVNLGLGKQFTYGPYRISTQLQVFNIFNADNSTKLRTSPQYDEDLQPVSAFQFADVQSPRAAQILVKFTF